MRQGPRVLLRDVYWSFSEPVPQSSAALIEAASAYAADIEAQDPRDALIEALPFSDVRLKYEYAERNSDGEWMDIEASVRVVGEARSRLTGADVLWELHVACATTVGRNDHHFFEGLEPEDNGTIHEPPMYRVLLGS